MKPFRSSDHQIRKLGTRQDSLFGPSKLIEFRWTAVARGAVMKALAASDVTSTWKVESRKSQAFFGIHITNRFKHDVHRESYKFVYSLVQFLLPSLKDPCVNRNAFAGIGTPSMENIGVIIWLIGWSIG